MNVADRLAALVSDVAGIDLPVRIRAWDGSEAGPADGPVLIVRSRRALRRLLWAPGEMGLARAYVTGDLDVDGDLADGLRRAWAIGGARSSPARLGHRQKVKAAALAARLGAVGPPPRRPASEARLTGRLHTRKRDVGGDRTPLRPVQRVLRTVARRAHGLLVGVLYRRRPVAARCADREAGHDLPQARSAAGHATARRRLRLGVADQPRRTALRGQRSRCHPVGRAA